MKIIPIKGRWVPASNIVAGVIICDHKYGAEASVSVGTDTYFDKSVFWGEMLMFKNNLKGTCFVNSDPSYFKNYISKIEATGKIGHDLYFMTDKWVNPITGVYEIIPDYYSSTWTAAGAAVFENAVAGNPKPTGLDGSGTAIIAARYPNHGQQIYEASSGDFGYNFSTNQIGESNLSELNLLYDHQQRDLELTLERKVSNFSYRNGMVNPRMILKNSFLGARNSSGRLSGPALTSYGFKQSDQTVKLGEFFYSPAQIAANPDLGWTLNHHINRQSTVQLESYLASNFASAGSYEAAYDLFEGYLTSLINGNGSTIKNLFSSGGWFQEFTHWHNMNQAVGWAGTRGDLRIFYERYLAKLKELLTGHFVFKARYGEIVEYHSLRDAVVRTDIYSQDDSVRVNLRLDQGRPLFQTPISLLVDFTGTDYESANFKPGHGCFGIQKLGSGKFVIEVLKSAIIEIDAVGDYLDFSMPTADYDLSENKITVNSNMPTNVVLYSVSPSNDVTEIARSNEFNTEHILDYSTGTSGLRLGLSSMLGESRLIEIN